MANSIYETERNAIISIRKRFPNVGAYALAARINRGPDAFDDSADMTNASSVGMRSRLSVLSVIRRYDAKNVFAGKAGKSVKNKKALVTA